MDFFESLHYRFNKRVLCCLGQWPLQSQNEHYFYRTMTVLIIASMIVPQMIKFISYLGDLRGMIECIAAIGLHFRSVVRFINSSVKTTTMRKLANRIKDDWTVRINEYDETLLRSCAERGQLLSVVYSVYMFGGTMLFLSIPLMPIVLDAVVPLNQSRGRIYLFQLEYFVDQDEYYICIMIHACIAIPVGIAIIVACDTMHAVYVHHACGIFATMGARLQDIQSIANHEKLEICEDHRKRTDKAYDDIVACIKMHIEAVEIAKLIESSCCISFLFVIGASIFTTTVTGFMTVTNLDQPIVALRYALVVVADLMHLFYICWQGHMLVKYSEDIFIKAYNVDWCDMPNQTKKLLIVIMLRSFHPCTLTAGKIFVLSMETYAAALKSTMSYFTVLLSMQ
nr:olfactory receptor 31 [Gregopimpla kuwanae]